ncbi:unnamed protein product [Prorocentrum cordatum]|uniref:Secreted protein n=1 Tax=Prorocentrum cordatum TaxID=2364126 RepID=A0ABN9WB82_9DINO|nr:unnamed protein product [Polarella glacialis]
MLVAVLLCLSIISPDIHMRSTAIKVMMPSLLLRAKLSRVSVTLFLPPILFGGVSVELTSSSPPAGETVRPRHVSRDHFRSSPLVQKRKSVLLYTEASDQPQSGQLVHMRMKTSMLYEIIV